MVNISDMKKILLVVLVVAAFSAHADVRCIHRDASEPEYGSTCPDEAPVCCFVGDEFSLGCCRRGQVCAGKGCVEVDLTNKSWTDLHDASVIVHLPTITVVKAALIFVAVIFLVFMSVFGFGECRAYLVRRKEERKRAAASALAEEGATNSDDDSVMSDEEASFRTGLITPSNHSVSSDTELKKVNVDTDRKDRPLGVVTCTMCGIAEADTLFLDCAHCLCCASCAAHLKYCPECKLTIRKRKKIFVAA